MWHGNIILRQAPSKVIALSSANREEREELFAPSPTCILSTLCTYICLEVSIHYIFIHNRILQQDMGIRFIAACHVFNSFHCFLRTSALPTATEHYWVDNSLPSSFIVVLLLTYLLLILGGGLRSPRRIGMDGEVGQVEIWLYVKKVSYIVLPHRNP